MTGGARASFEIDTSGRFDVVDITERVADITPSAGEGIALVFLPHTTAGLLLGPGDEGIRRDYVRVAERWLAACGPFEHAESGRPNAEAHILSAFGGTRLLLTVSDGRVDLGKWQRILLLEWDGPQRRTVHCRFFPLPSSAAVYGT